MSNILNDLDSFLKRIEPGVEAITGEERDITSFMRLMRIFNEVCDLLFFQDFVKSFILNNFIFNLI